jgi:Na+/melibiose symporter-like transporter
MGGCLLSPFVATAVAGSREGGWSLFYVVSVGSGVVNVGLVVIAFRDSLVPKFWERKSRVVSQLEESQRGQDGVKASEQIKATLRMRNMWLLSLFFFFYLGVAMTAGGWIVEYLVSVRNGDVSNMGYVSAGFNGGCFLGRILLPEITYRLGEKRKIFGYCVLALAMQLCFWL